MQSGAILRHIGRKYGLLGADAKAAAKCDLIIEQCNDFDSGLTGMCYRDYEKGRDAWVANKLGRALEKFEAGLSSDFAAGDHGEMGRDGTGLDGMRKKRAA